jgi:LacI family transcriptional regulator
MTTLMDVAEKAGVSKSTVSNVIRGTTSSAIGIVVPDLTNPFYAQLAVGVERAANALGYAVLTANTECLPETEEQAARAWIERRVDGVIIGGMALSSTLPKILLDREVPVVLASLGEFDDPRLGVIDHDDAAAMESIVAHLYDLGHRRLAFVSDHLREHAGERRYLGFKAALKKRRLVPIAIDDGATAVVAHNDLQAIATMDRLERRGLKVPDDVSVVGFDDIPLAAHSRIQLTTVRSDAVEMSRRAVHLVVQAARGNRPVSHREFLDVQLVVRSTTARPSK